MTTNAYLNNYSSTAEQSLIEDLIIESIQFYGLDVKYLPRRLVGKNETFREDAVSKYDTSYDVEMYVKNVEGFEGEGDFLSKFNIQVRDEITFTVAQKRYSEEVGTPESTNRPYEGDLIYLPFLSKKLYQVKFVEHEPVFYQIGALQMYDLRCELFEYSNEKFETGITEIDEIETKFSTNAALQANTALDANGNIIIDSDTGRPVGAEDYTLNTDPFADNEHFEDKGKGFIDFTENNPFGDV